MNYYQFLGVTKDCSQAELRAAYRKLARDLHPDVNPAPDATERMAEVNAAYSVLKDPAKRFEYDQELEFEKYQRVEFDQHKASAREMPLEPIICERCGALNETLSLVGFDYVVSILVLTWRGRKGGVYCDRCRTILSLLYMLEVLLFGWWGFPWGPLWSLPALFRNMAGGTRPRQPNAELSAYMAAFFAANAMFGLAHASAKRSYELSQAAETKEFIKWLDSMGGAQAQPDRSGFWRHSYLLNIAVVASIILGISAALSTSNPPSKASAPSNLPSKPSPVGNLQSEPSLPTKHSPPSSLYGTQRQYDNREGLGREIEALKLRADGLENEIESLFSRIEVSESEMQRMKREIEDVEQRDKSGLWVDIARYEELARQYNQRVPSHNATISKLENLSEEYDNLFDLINQKVRKYNQGY